jgi:hypothetical protein
MPSSGASKTSNPGVRRPEDKGWGGGDKLIPSSQETHEARLYIEGGGNNPSSPDTGGISL